MGVLCKLVDAILLIMFLVISVAAPLIDGQMCLPQNMFPDFLIDLKESYVRDYSDYLFADKPHFFVAIVWLELVFQWPLALLNVYGILASKSWFGTTCLIYGVSVLTSMVAILGELLGSQKASDKLLMVHYPFMGLGVLAMLRGLLLRSGKAAPTIVKRPAIARKKRA